MYWEDVARLCLFVFCVYWALSIVAHMVEQTLEGTYQRGRLEVMDSLCGKTCHELGDKYGCPKSWRHINIDDDGNIIYKCGAQSMLLYSQIAQTSGKGIVSW